MKFFKNNAGSRTTRLDNGQALSFIAAQYGKAVSTLPFFNTGNFTGHVGSGIFRTMTSTSQSISRATYNLVLFDGVPPEIAEIDSWTFSQAVDTIRPENRLLRVTNSSTNEDIPNSIVTATFPSTSAAQKTGKATWFIMQISPAVGTPTDRIFFVGTVGLIGSGADLELSEVDLIMGNYYQPPVYTLRTLPIGFDFED